MLVHKPPRPHFGGPSFCLPNVSLDEGKEWIVGAFGGELMHERNDQQHA